MSISETANQKPPPENESGNIVAGYARNIKL